MAFSEYLSCIQSVRPTTVFVNIVCGLLRKPELYLPLQGFTTAHQNTETCLLWVDAHADINTMENSDSGAVHVLLSRFYPDFTLFFFTQKIISNCIIAVHVLLSRFYPDCILILYRGYTDVIHNFFETHFIQISFYPVFIWITGLEWAYWKILCKL